ncbi:competence protein CoiA [Streptococcus sp. zg-86]|uniref:Competence protein CoiA n=1 Tax=Streptococcus zhangguiae TaxID=2664091 RepID=A0A6I4R9D7_9STRE|nr:MULTISPECIES: competence protein CoiA family protein [unclassified Streptococcus]MTB64299.1 competence protein CoiA [Streptococcus sp. zg-86]MTB90609.1 competence protein CoiA [Streptococcus sp. zg-36]MWV56396.1 competence protein CoiA [Streptococcus sp. zg-70]QTH47396.1 competence protein CoiA [Streptococcus sp. zg-86]
MLVAQNEQGQSVHLLEQQTVDGQVFFCPGCGGPVRLRKGQVMRPHFAHISLKNCHYFSENESEQHLQLKMSLYQWALQDSQAELEKRLPTIEQIADIFIADKLALEVQCSSLPIGRLQERTRSYKQAGYRVLWLLGKDLWLKKRLTSLQKQFLYFSSHIGFFLWELDREREKIRLRYLIHEDLHGRVQCLTKEFSFGMGNLLTILRFPYQGEKVAVLKGKPDGQLLAYIAKQLYHHSPKWLELQAHFYQKGGNLLTQTLDDFYPQIRLPESTIGFAQIEQDLSAYYAHFWQYYQQLDCKTEQYLYSPAFYQIKSRKKLGQ